MSVVFVVSEPVLLFFPHRRSRGVVLLVRARARTRAHGAHARGAALYTERCTLSGVYRARCTQSTVHRVLYTREIVHSKGSAARGLGPRRFSPSA